jgi:DNA-binding transcriptional MerR regulator
MAKKTTRKRPTTDDGVPFLRMRELVKATGLPKSTILFYANEGLLPEPIKTSSNMAYYHPDSIERLRFIKILQDDHRLPLSKIGRLLAWKAEGQDVTLRVELIKGVFGESQGPLMNEAAFCKATGLTRKQMKELIRARLLLPLEPGRFDREDVGMGLIYARGLAMGVKVEDMAFYPSLGKQIVSEEMTLRRRLTHDLPAELDAGLTLQLVQAARATRSYVIDRIFRLRIAAAKDLKDEELLS